MAAFDMSLVARSEYAVHQLMKREKNWAQREPGVIVVLVIVFLVFILVTAMFINKRVCVHPICPYRKIKHLTNAPTETGTPSRRRIRYPRRSAMRTCTIGQ